MIAFLLKRLGLSLVTLWLLSVMAFIGAQVLPGNLGRAMLGPFADQRAVDALNHEMGTGRFWCNMPTGSHASWSATWASPMPTAPRSRRW
jgi:ABC-type dipeptide/oligopeptide/nickel transport system permease component